jgi:hypothetical protein
MKGALREIITQLIFHHPHALQQRSQPKKSDAITKVYHLSFQNVDELTVNASKRVNVTTRFLAPCWS